MLTAGAAKAQHQLTPGIWRGVLKTASGNIPFNFEVKDIAGKPQMAIINGAERFLVTDIRLSADSVFIRMPLFDSEFRLKQGNGGLSGKWVRNLGTQYSYTDFTASPNTAYRFMQNPEKPAFNVGGRWLAIFNSSGKRDTTIGEFVQNGDKLTGTFLTTTGDYRYLEGVVSGNQFFLSCFDGGHAFLFTATIKNAGTITDGKFGSDSWTAIKDANAKLPDAYSLTTLKPGYKKLTFSFPGMTGRKVSLTDARFKNKVVIVQFMGSWCPNCMDETSYLVKYYKKYHPKGVEIIGLAYERTTNFANSKRTLTQLKKRFNIPYPLLITGYTPSKGDPAKSMPMLANFMAFPTTVIIDKKGNVSRIHTGYSGPGTGAHYTRFVEEFEKLTDHLLAEK
jgi:thiol-disulfide isomerase/thioredoxin